MLRYQELACQLPFESSIEYFKNVCEIIKKKIYTTYLSFVWASYEL